LAQRQSILRKMTFRLEMTCLSDKGKVRTQNEDAVGADQEFGIAVVADGIGGHRSGEVASRMAVDVVLTRLQTRMQKFLGGMEQPMPLQFAEQIVGEANLEIRAAAARRAERQGMGTTLALALFHGQRVALLHVGDSRIYRLRGGCLQVLTRDDSLLSDQVERGLIAAEDSRRSHNRHLVTQALGAADTVSVHLNEESVRAGDVFLLCTDGLSDLVETTDIELVVDALKTNLPLAASQLVQLACDNGGYDNVSVVLVRVHESADVGKGWFARLLARLTGGK
jgi:PPM family protein phosphatase